MLSKSSRIGNWRALKAVNDVYTARTIHSTSVTLNTKRRGPTSDVKLPELILDKQPDYYPTIQQKLDRIDYYGTRASVINIGYEDGTESQQNSSETAAHIEKGLKKLFVENEQDLLDELDGKVKGVNLKDEEYDALNRYHRFTKSYQNSTLNLANHFGIFRDLFQQEDAYEIDRHLLKANALEELESKMFEGRSKVYAFKPIVPMDCEFFIPDPDGSDAETMICQTAFRGNLIPSEFGRLSPQINIDTSGINGSFQEQETSPSKPNSLGVSLSSPTKENEFYTLAMVNLDSVFSDSGVCHWLLGNIHTSGSETIAEEVVKYLPVHGIRGLGYHRYCFVLFRHQDKLSLEQIQDYDLGKRRFNAMEFMDKFPDAKVKPVGLSWFQTSWSENCKDVFYKFLEMRSPTYEYEHPEQTSQFTQIQYPGRAPFNIYLDHFRDPKTMAKEVLQERLKGIDINKSYKPERMYPQFSGKPILPHIHELPENTPDWLKATLEKKREMVGRYRGLRAHSAVLPYDNNADLDNPLYPRISPDVQPLNMPLKYPDGKRRPKAIRDTLWAVPLPEHSSYRVDFPNQLNEDDRKELENVENNQ